MHGRKEREVAILARVRGMVCANDAFLKLATPKTKIAQAGAAIIRQGREALCAS
jgi:hypothetical protein